MLFHLRSRVWCQIWQDTKEDHTLRNLEYVMAKLTNWKSSGQKSISLWFSYHILPRQYTYIHLVIVSYHIIIVFLFYIIMKEAPMFSNVPILLNLLRQTSIIYWDSKTTSTWRGNGAEWDGWAEERWQHARQIPCGCWGCSSLWTTQAYESQLQDLPHELITKECLVFTGICNRSKDIGYRKTP